MKHLLFLCIVIPSLQLSAQTFTNVLISNYQNPEEISICISPKDTNVIAAGANITPAFHSADGGNTWGQETLQDPYGVWGDPCVISDTAGIFYYIHLANDPTITVWPRYCDRIVLQTSADSGQSFNSTGSTGYNLPNMQDKAWADIDPTTNYCAVSWTQFDNYGSYAMTDSSRIYFSMSKNNGLNWSTPVVISAITGDCVDSSLTAEGAQPAFGPHGQIYDIWSRADTLYMNVSLDTGKTWLANEVAIAPQGPGWDYDVPGLNRCDGLPYTTVDRSNSQYNGNIYVNWTDKRNGPNDADVFFLKSTDQGHTWSKTMRVNDDPAGKENFMSAMTVDQTNGDIYILYYDRRNYNDSTTDVYMAYSFNGGDYFANIRISSTPFIPNAGVFFGDYIGVSAVNGCVRPAWMRMDNGQSSAWCALINKGQLPWNPPPPDSTTAIKPIVATDEFVLSSANPTTMGCSIHYSGNQPYTLTVTDLQGKTILRKQTDTETFYYKLTDSNLSSGTYLINCLSPTTERTFKIVLIR